MTESQQVELRNTPAIKDALSRSRGFMSMGNRVAAVEVLESVQDKLSWQSGATRLSILSYDLNYDTQCN